MTTNVPAHLQALVMPPAYGCRVTIWKPGAREHGARGTVTAYYSETGWVSVEFDSGPPWRGEYELDELRI